MGDTVSNKKRKCFSLKDKHDIIKRLQQGARQTDICMEMGLSKSTVGTIWKKREEILDHFNQTNSKVKKVKKTYKRKSG